MTSSLLELLPRVLTTPTAPYHEGDIAALVDEIASACGAELTVDPFGNRIALLRGTRKGGPRLAFCAHMDHPGFDILSCQGTRAEARWLGGVRPEFFPDAKVLVHHDGGVRGRVIAVQEAEGGLRAERMTLQLERPVPPRAFGQWDLTPYELRDSLVVTRAADDLCSVVVQLAMLRELSAERPDRDIWFIFTRAEEPGFIGALAMLEAGVLPKDLPVVSLETSKALPGAHQGKGAVVRLGDRRSVFTSSLVAFMEDRARDLEKTSPGFLWQRRVMDGGSCEATAFIAFGHPAAGLAFPLGNYHNMGDEPDEQGRPCLRAETVHLDDLRHGLTLLCDICRRLDDMDGSLERFGEKLISLSRPSFSQLQENPV